MNIEGDKHYMRISCGCLSTSNRNYLIFTTSMMLSLYSWLLYQLLYCDNLNFIDIIKINDDNKGGGFAIFCFPVFIVGLALYAIQELIAIKKKEVQFMNKFPYDLNGNDFFEIEEIIN